jgi:hypothetical protein
MSTTELLRVSCDTSDGAWRIRLVGEADFSVLDDLTGALQGVTVRPGQEVLLDVGKLQFADVACMRALIRFAERAERLGARVYVEEPTATFTRLRRLLVADASRASDDGGRGA